MCAAGNAVSFYGDEAPSGSLAQTQSISNIDRFLAGMKFESPSQQNSAALNELAVTGNGVDTSAAAGIGLPVDASTAAEESSSLATTSDTANRDSLDTGPPLSPVAEGGGRGGGAGRQMGGGGRAAARGGLLTRQMRDAPTSRRSADRSTLSPTRVRARGWDLCSVNEQRSHLQ